MKHRIIIELDINVFLEKEKQATQNQVISKETDISVQIFGGGSGEGHISEESMRAVSKAITASNTPYPNSVTSLAPKKRAASPEAIKARSEGIRKYYANKKKEPVTKPALVVPGENVSAVPQFVQPSVGVQTHASTIPTPNMDAVVYAQCDNENCQKPNGGRFVKGAGYKVFTKQGDKETCSFDCKIQLEK